MKGITYYKLQSPYDGDITKNCSLDGFEVDSNFFNLEGRDIHSVTLVNEELIITLLNGETIKTSLKPLVKETINTEYGFNTDTGVLTIKQNDEIIEIGGFVTKNMLTPDDGDSDNDSNNQIIIPTQQTVAVDSSLCGNGSPKHPIGLSHNFQTGTYKPVIKLFDITNGEELPDITTVKTHDRFVTLEEVSQCGLLYNYETVKKIACELYKENHGWRIPTKDDWDDMLNAIELRSEDRDHNSTMSNKHLGRLAGKMLKSQNLWLIEEPVEEDTTIESENKDQCSCVCNDNKCSNTPYIGECGQTRVNNLVNPKGLDKYQFNILPVGYCDDEKTYQYYQKRAWYWTATNEEYTNAYTKRFDYNKSSVYQDIVSTDYFLSLRLVKDYNGYNHSETEQILGEDYNTVLLPSKKNGSAIWTATNIAITNEYYNAVLPSVESEVGKVKKYFINEWDGRKWLRNELKEGETVVIKEGNAVPNCVEYCVINGVLIDVTTLTYEQVLHNLKPQLDVIESSIKEETNRAINIEGQIEKALSDYKLSNDEKTSNLEDKLLNIDDRCLKVETKLNEEIKRSIDVDEYFKENIKTNKEYADEINSNLSEYKNETNSSIETINNNFNEFKQQTNTNLDTLQQDIVSINDNLDVINSDIDAIDGMLLKQDGTNFDPNTGILTLNSNGGTNNVSIQFSLNFGEI